MLLLQSHLEFQIVTPRTLSDFHGEVLILPDVRCIGGEELRQMESYTNSGSTLLLTGESGKYDSTGAEQAFNPLHKLLGIQNQVARGAGKHFVYRPECPGKAYYTELQREFDHAALTSAPDTGGFNRLRKEFVADLIKVWQPAVEVTASPFVSTQIATVNGKPSIFLANFKGLKSKEVAQQIPEENVQVTFPANSPRTIVFLPFLGSPQQFHGTPKNGKLSIKLPAIERGAVTWLE
jgi:hypothetical protein